MSKEEPELSLTPEELRQREEVLRKIFNRTSELEGALEVAKTPEEREKIVHEMQNLENVRRNLALIPDPEKPTESREWRDYLQEVHRISGFDYVTALVLSGGGTGLKR